MLISAEGPRSRQRSCLLVSTSPGQPTRALCMCYLALRGRHTPVSQRPCPRFQWAPRRGKHAGGRSAQPLSERAGAQARPTPRPLAPHTSQGRLCRCRVCGGTWVSGPGCPPVRLVRALITEAEVLSLRTGCHCLGLACRAACPWSHLGWED